MAGSEPWLTLKRGYEHSLRGLRDKGNTVFVAVADGEVAGFVVVHLRGPFTGYLRTIGVAEGWRNCGLGTRLVGFAENLIFKRSPNVFLCVSSFNQSAQRLYRRLGYRKVGKLKDYVVRGHSEFLMRKTRGPINGYKSQ